jgi:ATP-dependent Clp protease adaptor protein ClpS
LFFIGYRSRACFGYCDVIKKQGQKKQIALFLPARMMTFSFSYNPLTDHREDVDVLTENDSAYNLIVWNDEVNTFEWVIETLVEICGHSQEQAEQCAMIIHHKGKYAVKTGSYDDLKPQCDAINDRYINATIEELVS